MNKWLYRFYLKYNVITFNVWFSTKFCDDALKYIMNPRNMKENSNFKIIEVVKSTSKTILKHLLLSITFDAKY